ncbi:MAG: Nif3-like dinuclear metal center hexameric protein [Anaerosomatales bacterium]|nr:Nif3-like dinuclear metal center hexameric protein [Anaerosomatales bacterium]
MSAKQLRVFDVLSALEERFPSQWAEPWDRVGLAVGDPGSPVRSVLVTLDASVTSVRRAAEQGHDLLLTHHPLFLESPPTLTPGSAPGAFAAVRHGVAVAAFHTNLDRAPAGAEALPRALGLRIMRPLERAEQEVDRIVTYVPGAAVESVVEAAGRAGAGRIGEYERCAFFNDGTGMFEPLDGARPVASASGAGAPETRVEMVAPRASRAAVLAAIRDAHPYEEPVVIATEGRLSRGAARLGRLCVPDAPLTLASLATLVATRLGVEPRVWGDPERMVSTVAVGNGSVGGLVPDAIAAGADVLVGGEVRYHGATGAVEAGCAVIEAGHDATEWPLVRVLADAVRAVVADSDVRVVADEPVVAWWTAKGR